MSKTELFTIGEFSAITGVGIHSLRYYDEIGALKPEYVDPVSNYRYYGSRQLGLIPALKLCKDAGISLSRFDSFISDGSVDYSRLLNESRVSFDHRIDRCRLKQREIKQTEMLLSVKSALKSHSPAVLHLDSIDVWATPLDEEPQGISGSDMLRKLSSDARRHGQHIIASTCGIMQTRESGALSLYAFSQVSGDRDPHVCEDQLRTIPAGDYMVQPIEALSIGAAKAVFSDIPEAADSDTVFALAFICDGEYPSYCAAALIS